MVGFVGIVRDAIVLGKVGVKGSVIRLNRQFRRQFVEGVLQGVDDRATAVAVDCTDGEMRSVLRGAVSGEEAGEAFSALLLGDQVKLVEY